MDKKYRQHGSWGPHQMHTPDQSRSSATWHSNKRQASSRRITRAHLKMSIDSPLPVEPKETETPHYKGTKLHALGNALPHGIQIELDSPEKVSKKRSRKSDVVKAKKSKLRSAVKKTPKRSPRKSTPKKKVEEKDSDLDEMEVENGDVVDIKSCKVETPNLPLKVDMDASNSNSSIGNEATKCEDIPSGEEIQSKSDLEVQSLKEMVDPAEIISPENDATPKEGKDAKSWSCTIF